VEVASKKEEKESEIKRKEKQGGKEKTRGKRKTREKRKTRGNEKHEGKEKEVKERSEKKIFPHSWKNRGEMKIGGGREERIGNIVFES
jgi:hypothetical protein